MTDLRDRKGGPGDFEKALVEPTPKDVAFFEWLEQLFWGPPEPSSFPEKLEIRPASGKQYERLGPLLMHKPYGPTKEGKPNKAKIVELSNEILARCQRDCDVQRRPIVYCVLAYHFARDDGPYERWLFRRNPTLAHARDGSPRDDGDDEDENKGEAQRMRHHEEMFRLYGGGFEGLLDRFDRVLERQEASIDKKDARIEKLSEMLERALSLEEERLERRQWTSVKIKAVEKGIDMGFRLAPPLLNRLIGKSEVPLSENLETMTLKDFFKSLSSEESNLLLGVYDDKPPHECVKPGVFNLEQGKLLWQVANCEISIDELNKVMPGGSLEITGQQVQAMLEKCGISMDRLIPLHALFTSRQEKMQKSKK